MPGKLGERIRQTLFVIYVCVFDGYIYVYIHGWLGIPQITLKNWLLHQVWSNNGRLVGFNS